MLQADIVLTDYLLAVECLLFTALLSRGGGSFRRVKTAFAMTFAALGLAAFLGGTWHGFFSGAESAFGTLLWTMTLISLGLTAALLWRVAAVLTPIRFWSRAFGGIAIAQSLVFLALLFWTDRFALGSLSLVPPLCAMIVLYLNRYRRNAQARLLAGLFGFLLIPAAGTILSWNLTIAPLSPIALYHVVQTVAFWLVFVSIPSVAGQAE